MHIAIRRAQVLFIDRRLRIPLRLSSGDITEATEARVEVDLTVDGHAATGRSNIYLSDLWAWPDPSLTHALRDARLRARCQQIAAELSTLCGGGAEHPLELGLRLHHAVTNASDTGMPALAAALCASPFDAAMHDAVGLALNRSAFRLYDRYVAIPAGDRFFREGSAIRAVRKLLRTSPLDRLYCWGIVGPDEALERETLPFQAQTGAVHWKIKLSGRDPVADAARVAQVYRKLLPRSVDIPRLSVDTNEGNADAASVLTFLEALRDGDAEAFQALWYLEQPTNRDIRRYANDWHSVCALKPVLLDEGLTSLEMLPEIAQQGWAGLALKTCKGHSFALAAAAWAYEHDLPVTLQDLTNPGYSMIHAALFGAWVPTLNMAELNSPQFTPDANREWLPRLDNLIEPRDGFHHLPFAGTATGLGSTL